MNGIGDVFILFSHTIDLKYGRITFDVRQICAKCVSSSIVAFFLSLNVSPENRKTLSGKVAMFGFLEVRLKASQISNGFFVVSS